MVIAGRVISNPAQYKGRIDDNGRECSKCGTYKPWLEYGEYSHSPFGRRPTCKVCMNDRPKRDRRAATKKHLDYLRANDPLKLKAKTVRNGMLRRSTLPAPMPTEIEAWLKGQPLVCHYTGVELPVDDFSVDHKEPLERGGTNDLQNLCLTTKEMNTTKGTMTESEFKQLLSLVGGWADEGRMLARLRMAGHAFGSK